MITLLILKKTLKIILLSIKDIQMEFKGVTMASIGKVRKRERKIKLLISF